MPENGEKHRGKYNSDCWIIKNKKQNQKMGAGQCRGKVHLTCLLWEPYAAELDFIFRWMNCGGLRKGDSGWGKVGEGEIRFPFGCSHRHFHHCRQCRGKSPLHGAPGTQVRTHISVINDVERSNYSKEGTKLERESTWYNWPMVAEVGGMTLFTKKKSASSALKWILFRMRK